MGFFNKQGKDTAFTKIAEQIESAMATNQFALSANDVSNLFSMEGFGSSEYTKNIAVKEESIQTFLKEAGLDQAIADHLGLESVDHACVENALDAAAMAMIAAYDMDKYQASHVAPTQQNQVYGALKSPLDAPELSFEGYDGYDFKGFIGTTVVANAIAAASTPAEELFFRTIVCSGAQNGADITIRNPQVYTRQVRNASGKAYELVKKSVARAYIDSTILDGQNSTKIVPIAKDADANAAVLVATGDVANVEVQLGGDTVSARPFKYATAVDLIANSARPSLIGADYQDETYTLDPVIKLGTQYLNITDGTNTAKVKVNVDHLPGALLNPVAEGSSKELSTYFEGHVFLASTDLSIGGTALESALVVAAKLGLDPADPWKLKVKIRMSGHADLTRSNFTADFLGAEIVAAESDGEEITDISNVDHVVTGLGVWPTATRSNSNMAELGYIVDTSDEVKTRLVARMQAPLSIIAPPSTEGGSATVESVNMVKGITTTNRAVTRLLEAADYIKASSGALYGSFAIGQSAGIVPTCVEHNLVISDKISVFGSKEGLADMQGAVVAAANMIVLQMLQESGYLASLKTFTGVAANYEIVAMADTTLYSLFMLSGEPRTLGNGMNFKIEPCLDSRVDGKIIFSVRRTGVTKAEPHSFGCRPLMPSPIHTATPTRSGSTSKEIITVPREEHYVTCPTMAILNVSGHTTYFSTAA